MELDAKPNQTIIKPGLELAVFDAEAEIKKFPIKPQDLIALVEQYSGLTINGLADKEGYKAVSEARKVFKRKRVEIENAGKDTREGANKFAKMVIAKEKELVAIVEPTETKLYALEKGYEELVEEDEKEKERSKAARIQSMLEELAAVEFAIDIFDLQAMSDEQFNELLEKATADFEVTKTLREQARIAKEDLDKQIEISRLAKEKELEEERDKHEKERLEFEARKKAFEDQQAFIATENKRKQDELDKANVQLEKERKKMVAQRVIVRVGQLESLGMEFFHDDDRGNGWSYDYGHSRVEVLEFDINTLDDVDFGATTLKCRKLITDLKARKADDEQLATARAEADRLIREEEQKTEKMLRAGDAANFGVIRQDIEAVVRQFQTKAGAPIFKSKWGQFAVDTIKSKLNEAIGVCKANESTDEVH